MVQVSTLTELTHYERECRGVEGVKQLDCVVRVASLLTSDLVFQQILFSLTCVPPFNHFHAHQFKVLSVDADIDIAHGPASDTLVKTELIGP